MPDIYSDDDLIDEEIITHPERLMAVIVAAETLNLGWECQREMVTLRGEDGSVEEIPIHFRFRLYAETLEVDPASVDLGD